MVQKSKKPAPQDDFRNLEIQSVFNTNKHQHGIPQKELETRINQIYQVFEGKWQKADIRRALEENEYNVEEVIKLRLEGGEQWTEVKKKPTPQELRKKHSEIVNTGAPRGRPGRGSARGRGRGGVDRSNGRALKKSDDQKIEDTSNLTVPTGESIETSTVDQQQHIGSEIEIEHVATEGADKSQRTKQPRDDKKKSRSEKFVPAQQPRQEQVLSYSQVAAISDEVKPQQQEEKEEKPQKVNINKKQQTKPKRRPQDQQDNLRQQTSTKTVEQPPVTIQQQTVQPVTHTQQQPKVQQRQKEEPKKFINAQPDSLPTTSTTTGFRSSGIQFGSLSNDEHVEEEQQQQPKVPQQQEQQPSAPQIQNRRQSQHENQSLQDFNYQGNTGSWGEEQQYQQQYNQDTMNQFHENQGFFANNYVPHHQQQPNETSATTGTKGDKDTQNSQKQANYSGYPMHPYSNPMQAQGYSYYGGYPHPYMLHGQYAQQQYGYSMQQYPKYGFKGYSGPTSPTYGSGAPSDEKGNQQQPQQQQQQQQHQQHQQQHMMHNQYGMAPYMMMPQYIPDPSATEKQESLKNRSPQNADHAEQHGMQYYPYGVPYSQYANYMYQPHPHSTMFAHQHQQGPQSTQSGTHAHQQQQRGANDTWSS